MTRLEGWEDRAIEAIMKHADKPFELGVSDCYLLPIDVVMAVTGQDPWPEVRGAYSTDRGALKQLRQRGYDSLADAFADVFVEITSVAAQRGDLGIVDSPRGMAGVVFWDLGVIGKGEFGLQRQPRSAVLRAFKV